MADPSEKLFPARTLEDQEMEIVPIVAGPPPYSSPDPSTDAQRMFDLTEGSNGGPSQEAEVEGGGEQEGNGGEELEAMNKAELQERAAELEIEGRSQMNKDELIDAIEQAETEQANTQT